MVEALPYTQGRLLRIVDVSIPKTPPRKLHSGYFAFMRALAKGWISGPSGTAI